MLSQIISRLVSGRGPAILQARRDNLARLRAEIDQRTAERDARIETHMAQRRIAVEASQRRLDALIEEHAPTLSQLTLYRSTRGWIDSQGNPISAEMAEAYEAMNAGR